MKYNIILVIGFIIIAISYLALIALMFISGLIWQTFIFIVVGLLILIIATFAIDTWISQ